MAAFLSMLVTSEMMQAGDQPLLFIGGAANILGANGPVRNPGRDPLAQWLDRQGWSYFDPQIHPSTHGRDYEWQVDAPQEKRAREQARLRIYEITATTIGAGTMLEILEDVWRGRQSVVWINGGHDFAPPGLGDLEQLNQNVDLRHQIGEGIYYHLLAYVNAGRQIRRELRLMLADSTRIRWVSSLEELKSAVAKFFQDG